MITFSGLTKTFKSITAVNDFTLDIKDGEIMGLLGPNGAGKTTLILTMATVYQPTRGSVSVDGYDVTTRPTEVRSLIGIAFQDPRFDRLLSVLDVLEWHAKITGVPSRERAHRLESVMKRLGLWEIRRQRTWALSGGMKKKVEDAKIFIQCPKVAVFDEPTAFLDVPSRLLVWDMIKELQEDGRTVILATNMMDEAERLSERVAIMNMGGLVALGSPSDLKQTVEGSEVLEIKPTDLDHVDLSRLKLVPGVSKGLISNDILKLFLSRGRERIPQVMDELRQQGVEIESLFLKEATLEDVFLKYTGSNLS